ncbi:hypothetical protein ACIQBJ_33255 [Kitasatospora sp. NPDC088391]|uniref:hypothetical protein n=1 Tax=Kitasatospora sp. NPDC088391 TaxID=3364074 RepID=UPI003830A5BA
MSNGETAGRPGPVVVPEITEEERNTAARQGGWVFRSDPGGGDGAGPMPPEAVLGGWRVDAYGGPPRFRPNPRYGVPAAGAGEAAGAAPLPPLRAGRRPAGRALLGWLDDARAPRLCRVTGSSGSGRSHLLRWLAAACPPDHPRAGRRVHAVLDAAEATPEGFVRRLAALLGVSVGGPDDLVAALVDGVPRVLVVTDLDRAGGDGLLPDAAERIAAEVLRPLLAVPWLRIVVESAGQLADLPAAVLDLDDPQWTDRAAFADWAAGLTGRRLPDGVFPSPALALLAARTVAGTPAEAGAEAEAGAALEAALVADAPLGERAEALAALWWAGMSGWERAPLIALASVGGGLEPAVWADLPGGGGAGAVEEAAARLLPPDGRGRYRIWPRDFGARLDEWGMDHLSLCQNLLPERPGPGDAARLGLLLRHAVRTGNSADPLLGDPAVLVHADPSAVELALARDDDGTDGKEEGAWGGRAALRRAWWAAGAVAGADDTAPDLRAEVLHAWLADADRPLADRLAGLTGQAWRSRWSFVPPTGAVDFAVRENGPSAGSGLTVVAGGELGTLDAETGRGRSAGPLPAAAGPVGLATGPDGTLHLLLPGGAVESVRPPGAEDGPAAGAAALPGLPEGGVTAIAARGGGSGVLVLGDAGGRLHLREGGGATVSSPGPWVDGAVTAVDVVRHAGAVLVIAGGPDGAVRTWAPGQEAPAEPLFDRPAPVTAVALASTPQGLMAAVAWADGELRAARWGEHPALVGPRLGAPVLALTVTDGGLVCAATRTGVLGLDLDGPAAG